MGTFGKKSFFMTLRVKASAPKTNRANLENKGITVGYPL
jgi:hypothetical protein